MEIRKFIVELPPDGKMTWYEYEEPKTDIFGFSAGSRRTVDVIIEMLEERKKKHQDISRLKIQSGFMSEGRDSNLFAMEDDYIIREIKKRFLRYSKRPYGPSTGTARPVLMRQGIE